MEIFKLFGSVFLKSDEADKRLDKINKKGKSAGDTFKSMGKLALGAGAVVGAGIGVAAVAIGSLVTKTGEAADRLLDLNSITGMTTDAIQQWEQAAIVAGVSAEAMTSASQDLTKSMDIITTTGGKGAEALEQLGLSVDEVANMNADERMNVISESLAGVEDKTLRAKLGTDLLKGSWKEIAPIVDLGAEGMKKAKENANIISEEDLKKANDFRIAMDEMKKKVEVLGMELAIKFLPVGQHLMNWFQKIIPIIEVGFKKAMDIIVPAIQVVRNAIAQLQHDIGKWIFKQQFAENSIFDSFEKIKNFIDEVVGYIVDNILPPLIEIFTFIYEELVPVMVEAWQEWFPIIAETVKKTWDLIKVVLDILVKTFERVFPLVKSVALTAFNFIKEGISAVMKVFNGLITFLTGVFTGNWEKAWSGIASIFTGVWDLIKAGLKASINFIIGMLNQFVRNANRIISKVNEAPGISLPNIPEIPRLAKGGMIRQGGSVIVGDGGEPEIVDLPRGARVTPLSKAGGMGGGVTVNIVNPNVMGDEGADWLGDILVERLRGLGVAT